MGRYARAMGLLVVVMALSACKKPKAGDPCKTDGKQICIDKASSVVCVDGKWESLPCRGVTGCMTTAGDVSCSNESYNEGEPCDDTTDKFDCTPDKKAMVKCDGSHWKLNDKCLGPLGCVSNASEVNCDDSFSEVGAICYPEGDPACSVDGKQMLKCKDGKMESFLECRGVHACRKLHVDDKDKIDCDDSLAKVGDPCVDEDDPACSVDKKAMLKCKGKKMVEAKKCKGGCTVMPDSIECN